MTKFHVDEEHLNEGYSSIKSCVEAIMDQAEKMKNQSQDTYTRYQAYIKIVSFLSGVNTATELAKKVMCFGFDISARELQTERSLKAGFHSVQLDRNPFFITDEEKKEREHPDFKKRKESLDELKEILSAITGR